MQGHGRLREWLPERTTLVGALAAQARGTAKCHGRWAVYDANRRGTSLRVVTAKRTRLLRPADDSPYRKRAVEPRVLATTRKNLTPAEVVALYVLRMRIEEMFRDDKNARYGGSLEHISTQSAERLEVLLLIATLAMLRLRWRRRS